MAATAARAYQEPVPISGDPSETSQLAKCLAVIDQPDDPDIVDAFASMLDDMDPCKPRSETLTTALVCAMSDPGTAGWKADRFAQQSLRNEFAASLASEVDRIGVPSGSLSLLTAVLYHRRIHYLLLEDLLISLRSDLLEMARSGETPPDDLFQLAEAMARHNFLNEYIWDETEAERDTVDTLVAKISDNITTGASVSGFDLFMIGTYRPLHIVDAVRSWVRALGNRDPNALDPTLRLLVHNCLLEDDIKIEAVTPISSQISKDVRSQYEENPYPRWRHMPTAATFNDIPAYVAAGLGLRPPPSASISQHAKVLIAGAGTGAHPISVAQSLPNAAVLAIDLSRASLAYATREAATRNVGNLAFAQADILKLSGVNVAFDLIESAGVLHHMEDPEAGLQALLRVLKPGGHLRLALYSQRARQGVNAARKLLETGDYPPGVDGIRAFRRDLLRATDPALVALQTIPDFFAASEFRDLVMHVQEHQFTLPQISAMLKRNGLKFIGFSSQTARAALREMPAKTARRRLRDLEAWDKFEKRHPETFISMYDFFCVKR